LNSFLFSRYQPSTGYTWVFEPEDDDDDDDHDGEDTKTHKEDAVVAMLRLAKRNKRRKILDNRPAGERSAAEEEGIRAAEAMESILVRLSKSDVVTNKITAKSTRANPTAAATTSTATAAAAAAAAATPSSTAPGGHVFP
jgi:hypothetical protein